MTASKKIDNPYVIALQPSAKEDFYHAVVSWTYDGETVAVLSRVKDDVWCAAKKGALVSGTEAMRRIDFTVLPPSLRAIAKAYLYAALRHPYRINTTPQFSTLIKKAQAIFRYLRHLHDQGITDPATQTQKLTEKFLKDLAKKAKHLETLVGQIAAITEVNTLHQQGKLSFKFAFAFHTRGATGLANKLWKEVHGKPFDKEAIQPFEDDDAAILVRSALFYVETIGPALLYVAKKCMEIAQKYPLRRTDDSQEGKCYREQLDFLSSVAWPFPDAGFYHWPPKNAREITTHLRLLSASSAILILFAIGCRRTELLELKDDCIHLIDGEQHIRINYRKGENDLLVGRPVSIAACKEIVAAVETQSALKKILLMDDLSDGWENFLFVAIRRPKSTEVVLESDGNRRTRSESDRVLQDEEVVEGDDVRNPTGARLSVMGLAGMLRDFKKYVAPDVVGSCNPHRFRKTIARLILLTMEGAPLILQTIFGHAAYKTTLRYMFSSPFIQDEIIDGYPELAASNLRVIFQSQDDLGGEGGRRIRDGIGQYEGRSARAQRGEDVDMTEDELTELGIEMMQLGQMTLSVVGPGTYCLKPLTSAGPCSADPDDKLPNPGKCTSSCNHNVRTKVARERSHRTIIWLKAKLGDDQLTSARRRFYTDQLSSEEATLSTWRAV